MNTWILEFYIRKKIKSFNRIPIPISLQGPYFPIAADRLIFQFALMLVNISWPTLCNNGKKRFPQLLNKIGFWNCMLLLLFRICWTSDREGWTGGLHDEGEWQEEQAHQYSQFRYNMYLLYKILESIIASF